MQANSNLKLVQTDDGSYTLFNPTLNETYHSLKGAIAESRHVFIHTGLEYVLKNLAGPTLSIFEVGFGTGLNAFLSYQFLKGHSIDCRYRAVETFPLEEQIYTELNYFSGHEYDDFLTFHRLGWNREIRVFPRFRLAKMNLSLEEDHLDPLSYDLVYYDAFAPSRQPEIWSIENLRKCLRGLKPGGVFVTYCAQGQFKRNLIELGFDLEVLPGALGKKEMVRASKPST